MSLIIVQQEPTERNFDEDVNCQHLDAHSKYLKSTFENFGKQNVMLESLPKNNRYGDILVKYDSNKKIECKSDFWCFKTGNFNIELISYIKPSLVKTESLGKILKHNSEYNVVLELISNINTFDKNDYSLGLGLTPMGLENLWISYLCFKNRIDVKSSEIFKWCLLNAKELQKFIVSNYNKHPINITKSSKNGKQWCTISSLIPFSVLKSAPNIVLKEK